MYYSRLFHVAPGRAPGSDEEAGAWLNALSTPIKGLRVSVDAVVSQGDDWVLVVAHTWLPGPSLSPLHTDVAQEFKEPEIDIGTTDEGV